MVLMLFSFGVKSGCDQVDHFGKRAVLAMADLVFCDGFDGVVCVFGANGDVRSLEHFKIVIIVADAPDVCAVVTLL